MIIRINFSTDSIRDLEIKNDNLAKQELSAALKLYNLNPLELIVILAPELVFQKQLSGPTAGEQEKEVQDFLNFVPFEKPLSRIYTIEGLSFLLATNKQLLFSLKRMFEDEKHSVTAFVPLVIIDKPYNTTQELNPEFGEYMIKKYEELKQLTVLEQLPPPVNFFHYDNSDNPKKNNKLPLLLIVLFGSLIILGILIFLQNFKFT